MEANTSESDKVVSVNWWKLLERIGRYEDRVRSPDLLIQLTRWVRVRLRAALWRQWKTQRRRRAMLIQLGVRSRLADNTAGSGHGPWHLAR
jgi:hypothetical protein